MLNFREWLVTEDQAHPDQQGFDAAIRENPGDHTAYLAYADWAAEHGRPWLENWLRAVADNGIAVSPITISGGPLPTADPSSTGPVLVTPQFATPGTPPAESKAYALVTFEGLNQKPQWTSSLALRGWLLQPVSPGDHPQFLMDLCDSYNKGQTSRLRDTILKISDGIPAAGHDLQLRDTFDLFAQQFIQPIDPRPLRPQPPAPRRRRPRA